MKILMVNKFLYPNGGSETYIMKLAEALSKKGHDVEFFGMADDRNTVGNSIGEYTKNKDFRGGAGIEKLLYPLEIVYSHDARKKIKNVINSFKPDVVHLNNINFQITPSIIYELKGIPIIWTAHDTQLVCPQHLMFNASTKSVCRECLDKNFISCVKNKCIHGSTLQSALGAFEAMFYKMLGTYKRVDKIICPSEFMAKTLRENPIISDKTTVLRNFVEKPQAKEVDKEDYVLYFGRYEYEKGIEILIEACKKLPDIQFVFAGSGEFESRINEVKNIKNVGFKSGDELSELIKKARFSVCPSIVYENCPFSVMEAIMNKTPVLGAKIGGIPELIDEGETGMLFEAGNTDDMCEKISMLWNDKSLTDTMSQNCARVNFDDVDEYADKLIDIVKGIKGNVQENTIRNSDSYIQV